MNALGNTILPLILYFAVGAAFAMLIEGLVQLSVALVAWCRKRHDKFADWRSNKRRVKQEREHQENQRQTLEAQNRETELKLEALRTVTDALSVGIPLETAIAFLAPHQQEMIRQHYREQLPPD